MKVDTEPTSMTEGRGLLTESEREAIAGERSDSYRYKTRTYVRNRLEEIEKDVDVLEEHAPELLEDLREAVCETAAVEPRERREAPTPPMDNVSPTEAHAPRHAPETERDDPTTLVGDVVDEIAEGWDDVDERLEARKAAAKAVLEHAVETGDAIGRSDAVDGFLDEYPVAEQNPETWWRKNVRAVLREIGDYSNAEHGYQVDRDDLEAFLDGDDA